MDCLLENDTWSYLLIQYGSITLFVLLALGIIALPIPEETLMVFAGALMGKGILIVPFTVLAALAGSVCGITLSYLIGRTGGSYLLHKYGSWAGITEWRLHRAKRWFERFGKWTLVVGYFIPGVRHFTGLSAGVTGLHFKQFALFAYFGAVLWISTFLSIGYFFGGVCLSFLETIDSRVINIALGIIILFTVAAIVNKWVISRFKR